MSGIAGIRSASVDSDYPRVTVAAMTRRLAHRGPDSSGIWIDIWHGVALGHRGLSVIDPAPAGDQPLVSPSGRFVITYDGEIYNSRALAAELSAGVEQSSSDVPVLLASLDEWGLDETLGRLNGRYAFGLWDRWTGTLSLVTDRLGQKPVYFASFGSDVVFASELKALTGHDAFDGAIDAVALDQYLKKGFVPAPRSIFRQVSKLAPGSVAVIRRGQAPQVQRYWSPAPPRANNDDQLNLHDAVEALDELLTDSVRLRLPSHVTTGVFFSGGIDSTAILAKARSVSDGPVTAFTLDFEGTNRAEASSARALARYLDCDHVEATLSSSEALAIIPELPTIYDEPFADSSSIAMCLLARLARSHVTVALGGDGGDELFCGYLRYHWANRFWPLWRDAPSHVRRAAETALSASSAALGQLPWMPSRVTRLAVRLERISDCLSATDAEVLYQHLTAQRDAGRFLPHAATEAPWLHPMPASRDELLAQLMWLDTTDYLPNDILVKVDRATMSVGLEERLPMLDHRLVEWASRLPSNIRLRGGVGKRLLRHLLYRDIPSSLLERPSQSFALPVGAWLRGALRDWAEDLLSERSLQSQAFLDAIEVRRQWSDHVSGRRDWRHSLWPLLMFLSWEREMRATRVIPSAGSDFAAVG